MRARGPGPSHAGKHVPLDTLLALFGIALIAFLALIVVSPGPLGERLRRAARRTPADDATRGRRDPATTAARCRRRAHPATSAPTPSYRVIRVATWVFIFAASTVVAVTDLWAAQQGAILVLLAIAAITLLVIHAAPWPASARRSC